MAGRREKKTTLGSAIGKKLHHDKENSRLRIFKAFFFIRMRVVPWRILHFKRANSCEKEMSTFVLSMHEMWSEKRAKKPKNKSNKQTKKMLSMLLFSGEWLVKNNCFPTFNVSVETLYWCLKDFKWTATYFLLPLNLHFSHDSPCSRHFVFHVHTHPPQQTWVIFSKTDITIIKFSKTPT